VERIPSIKSVMTAFPYSIDADASLREAREMLLEHEIRHLPVKDGERLVGVITDRDLKRALDPSVGMPPENELVVRDVAVFDAYVVDLGERLDKVLERMAQEHIGCALVTRQGKLAGIFTNTDACQAFADYLRRDFHRGPGGRVA
jgi:acetoin utilization protein AcuB